MADVQHSLGVRDVRSHVIDLVRHFFEMALKLPTLDLGKESFDLLKAVLAFESALEMITHKLVHFRLVDATAR